MYFCLLAPAQGDVLEATFDVQLILGVTDTMKAKGRTITLHQVGARASLDDIKRLIRAAHYDDVQPTVGAGLYWLKRKGQDCIDLKTDEDLQKAKSEHTRKGEIQDLRLAVAVVKKAGRKRDHQGTDSDDEVAQFIQGKSVCDKGTNSQYNTAFVELVRNLERKGTKNNYTNKHLNLWTEMIVQGRSSGVEDPPNWNQYLERIEILPRDRRLLGQRRDSLSDVFYMQMTSQREEGKQREEDRRAERKRQEELDRRYMEQAAEQRRSDEIFRTTMLTLMAPHATRPPSTSGSTDRNERPLAEMSVADIKAFMDINGFERHAGTFELNGIDGPTLLHANHELLEALGISSVIERAKLLGLLSKAK